TFTSTASDGLPSPDSRLAMVERGTVAALASASCVSERVWRRLARLRARWLAVRDSSLILFAPRSRSTAPAPRGGELAWGGPALRSSGDSAHPRDASPMRWTRRWVLRGR